MRSLAVRRGIILALGMGAAALVAAPPARACMLDQRPSVSADGRLAQLNRQPPATAAQLASWAPFVFARTFPAGAAIAFTEDRTEVAASLVAAAMRRPWRWTFGDGDATEGWTVRHAYRRPGAWRVTVAAYFPATGRWYTFDRVRVVVAAAPSAGRQGRAATSGGG